MKKIFMILLLVTTIFAAPRTGDKDVNFTLPDLYNPAKTLSNTDLRGKVVLLNLWASWCTGCQEEMPLFVELQKEFKGKGFEIVLSSIDSDPQNSLDFLAEVDKEKVLTSLYDVEKRLPKAYRCPGMPSSFLIDKTGKIVAVYIGSLDENAINALQEKVSQLLGE